MVVNLRGRKGIVTLSLDPWQVAGGGREVERVLYTRESATGDFEPSAVGTVMWAPFTLVHALDVYYSLLLTSQNYPADTVVV